MLKQLAGPLYPSLVRLRHNDAGRFASALLGFPQYQLARRRRPQEMAVRLATRQGMGAMLAQAVLFHALADERGIDLAIIAANPLYSDGADAFAFHFETNSSAQPDPISSLAFRYAFRFAVARDMTLGEASEVLRRHFKPLPGLAREIHGVLGGRSQYDASVHIRGTDKALEATPVSMREVFRALDRVHDEVGGPADVFLATDEPEIERQIRARYSRSTFTTYTRLGASVEGPRHFAPGSGMAKGLEALVNIYAIAAAPVCVRTSSYMSGMSKVVNPELRTRTLNRTERGTALFPERQIIAAEAMTA